MGKTDLSSPQDKIARNKKELNKQKRRLQERLEKARKARTKSEERLKLAQEQFQLKAARVQKLEQRLLTIHSRLVTISLLSGDDNATEEGPSIFDEEEQLLTWDLSSVSEHDEVAQQHESLLQAQAAQVHNEAAALAHDARSIAGVAEEAARVAVARTEYAEKRLAKESIGRHLAQEYEHLQSEAQRAQIFAYETAQAADEAEQLLVTLTPTEDTTLVDIERVELSSDVTFLDDVAKENDAMFDEIEKDEDAFAAVASLILADAEADEAAESEAILEASSEHMVDMHEMMKQADYTLSLVRAAVKEGTLTGEDAVRALTAAEMEVAHARSLVRNLEKQLEEEQHATEGESEQQT
ncbi:hypothetical protein [Dictyobacter formicarum]|uniref:BZIP domain-containing protein n=1 Tax=Dictyobacter formicarum TaxID=2778368 RepID=A0ABQ3VUP2_9CHLR|nr:hypothetical protein [Dictyobacter formicarum]GHO89602.1 hypothetical protein KSZ_76080 [Dictyobacter formicarum]